MIKLVLLDDHPVFVQGVKALFSRDENINVVQTFTSSIDLFKYLAADEELPEVLLLDIDMGKMSGVEVAKNVIQLYSSIKVIMFSTYFSNDLISDLLETGISGYLLKSTGFNELKNSITKVSDGKFCCSPEIMEVIVEGYKHQNLDVSATPEEAKETGPLSERELELLQLIADELTMKEIAEKVFLSEHTVKTHRKNLMAKLDVKNTAGLIKKAFILGLIE